LHTTEKTTPSWQGSVIGIQSMPEIQREAVSSAVHYFVYISFIIYANKMVLSDEADG